jgi:hypothetical protein
MTSDRGVGYGGDRRADAQTSCDSAPFALNPYRTLLLNSVGACDEGRVGRGKHGAAPFLNCRVNDTACGVVLMPQTDQADPLEHLSRPLCLRCRAARMSLMHTEEEYPGYTRRMFECPICGETMTQWAGIEIRDQP